MINTGDLINNRFSLINKLGEGAFGFVWSAYDNYEMKRCAIKFVNKTFFILSAIYKYRYLIKKALKLNKKFYY